MNLPRTNAPTEIFPFFVGIDKYLRTIKNKANEKLPLLVLGVSLLLQPGFAQEQIPDGESLPFSGLTVREARRVNARLQNIYQKAVKEAQEITPGKMSDRLWSVDDPWVDRKGDSLVLVVAAIQTKDLPKWTGKATKQAPASRDEAIWVSLSPELGMVMHNQPLLDSLSAAMRIKQILGLPPQADYGYIVQFWVPVSQLVRPTPDPDVHNHFSTVKFPQQVDPGHKQWIEHLRSTTYISDPPYHGRNWVTPTTGATLTLRSGSANSSSNPVRRSASNNSLPSGFGTHSKST